MPTVSVIIPNYNHEPYLKARIDSVLAQTYQDFEVIILDDVSPDHSIEIIEQYKNNPKIAGIYINEINSGSTFKQWNKGVQLATGKYIWLAESDDVAEPTFLETMVHQLENNNQLVLAYCQSNKMNAQGQITGDWIGWTDSLDKQQFLAPFSMNGTDYIEKFLLHKCTIPNASAAVFLKDTYLKAGQANPNLKYIGDWELWLKLLTLGSLYYTPERLNNFRYHNKSVISLASVKEGALAIKTNKVKLRESFKDFLQINNFTSLSNIFELNNKELIKDQRSLAVMSIRKRVSHEIIPTSKKALKTFIFPFNLLAFVILILLNIYSFTIGRAYEALHKK